jgi:preprotein translocase subunit SecA
MNTTLKKLANYFSPSSIKLREALKIVPLINKKEEEFSKFSHQDILNKTLEFKERFKCR